MQTPICNGDGSCIVQCGCECYDENTDIYDEECSCGHREHDGFCYSVCCFTNKCKNYKYCNEKMPQWVLNSYNGMSANCFLQMGRHETTDIIKSCPVCFEDTKMIILKCKHLICNDCWYQISDKIHTPPQCPLCRNKNDWSFT